ncbi:MAG: phenylacetate-CoA oxygenase/reductase subunit PaaK [Chitinophagaceae bacterium]|nr:phenylacetate-CoA oxygenase/reductase subunit PaaK [Chitinophagaceae bacterium]
MHFKTVSIKDVRKETADCVSVAFDIPSDLKDFFTYRQGQYITIKLLIAGQSVRRCYSICSSPLENELRIAIKKVTNGVFSTYANEVFKKGDTVEMAAPSGKFYSQLDAANENNYMAFAAGSGITPIISIIKTTLATEKKSSFTLIFGNRNRYSIIFKDALEALKNKYLHRFRIVYILSREKTDTEINSGRIDANKCRIIFGSTLAPTKISKYFLCGPEAMIFEIKNYLEQLGVEKKKILFELFTSAKANSKTTVSATSSVGNPSNTSKVSVKLDGISSEFDLHFDGPSILNKALLLGIELPFACKAGVCCTCKAKLLEGEVSMDAVYGLEPEEIDQGYILTCQSHPLTKKIVVDFDS